VAAHCLEANSADPNLHSVLHSCSTLAIKLTWLTRGSERQVFSREHTEARDGENRSANILCFL